MIHMGGQRSVWSRYRRKAFESRPTTAHELDVDVVGGGGMVVAWGGSGGGEGGGEPGFGGLETVVHPGFLKPPDPDLRRRNQGLPSGGHSGVSYAVEAIS